MRKLLINSTAIATVAAITASVTALTASVAVADVSISATTEFKYISRSSQVTATDGTETKSDSEIAFKFSNKTDNGLTVGYVVELQSDGGNTAIDESSFSIAGGFGKVVLGENDGVGENFGIAAEDIVSEEERDSVVSATISTGTDIIQGNGNAIKVAYFLPAMGGFTAGISHADSGNTSGTDTTSYGAHYTMDAGGNTITIGGATTTTEAASTDTDSQNLGVKIVSGNLKVTVSQGTFEAVDEDRSAQGIAAAYKLANGVILSAFTLKSEDDSDVGEEYSASGVEAIYTIAAGLTAVVGVTDYEYTKTTGTVDAGMSAVSDSGTTSALTIKAKF